MITLDGFLSNRLATSVFTCRRRMRRAGSEYRRAHRRLLSGLKGRHRPSSRPRTPATIKCRPISSMRGRKSIG
ncbi:hypothetical protein D3C78_1749540 [compost metagenome]